MAAKQSILIIEDEEVILDVLSTKLQKEGFTVFTAKNGEEGIATFKEKKPSIVLLDIIMPKQDGYDVLRAAQKDTSINKTPIIIISNSGQPVEIDKALQLGAVDYLIKAQFEPEEVVEKINQAFITMKNAPETVVDEKPTKPVENTKPAPAEKITMSGKKILIVEDDQFLRELITRKLSSEGFSVTSAETGEIGFQKIISVVPSLVLLDIILPEVNGFEILERVRKEKDPKISKIPIIMLSNLGQESDIKRGQELGANDYLVKASLTTDEIVKKLQSFL